MPQQVGRNEGKQDRVVIAAFQKKVAKVVLYKGDTGCVKDDVNTASQLGKGIPVVLENGNFILPDAGKQWVMGICFTYRQYFDPAFPQQGDFLIKTGTHSPQPD